MATRNGVGMPCLGAGYLDPYSDRHRLLDGATCPVCGKPATDSHHQPPKGMGGGSSRETVPGPDVDGHLVRPGLVALCHVCHMRLHQRNEVSVKWRWDSPQLQWLYEDGDLAPEFYDEPDRLWALGCWEFHTTDKAFTVRLDPDGNMAREEI